MDVLQLQTMCDAHFGARGGNGQQAATGAFGHVKGQHFAAPGVNDKRLYVASQGGPSAGPIHTLRVKPAPLVSVNKWRDVVDARNFVLTGRKKGEWTGYHAEMVIVSCWLNELNGALAPPATAQGLFAVGQRIIAANATCCKHCHFMLNYLGIQHPIPPIPTASLTGWWNPLTDARFPHADPEFARNIPGNPVTLLNPA